MQYRAFPIESTAGVGEQASNLILFSLPWTPFVLVHADTLASNFSLRQNRMG